MHNERIEAESQHNRLDQDLAKHTYKHGLLELRSPQAGMVKDLATHTPGTVVAPGAVIATIVPHNEPLLADPEGSLHTQSFLLRHSGTFFLRVPASVSPTSYAFRLEKVLSSTWETEDNDAIARANPLDMGGRASGVVIDNNDDDFFSFQATMGVPVTIAIYAAKALHSDGFFEYSGHGSALPSRVRLLNMNGQLVGESHYGKVVGSEGVITGLPTGAAAFIPPSTGTYYARVEAVNNLGQADYHYVIEKR